MPQFEVLMPQPLMPMIASQLSASCKLHYLWEAADQEAELVSLTASIRAIATGGGYKPLKAGFLGRFPKLEIIASFGVGYDHIDVEFAAQNNIIITNTPDVLNEEVADTALGLLLATLRQIPQADKYLRAGKWPQAAFPLTATMRGRTLGILGLGRIGKAIAIRAESFGLKVIYHGRKAQEGVPYLFYPTLTGMAQACDILMVITPGGPETRHIVNAQVLDALGPNGILINVARGSVVDESALIEALGTRKILGAGLDVFANEPHVPQALLDMDHIVLLPHVGSATFHTRDAMAQLVIDNLLSWTSGKGPLTPVDETPWPSTAKRAE